MSCRNSAWCCVRAARRGRAARPAALTDPERARALLEELAARHPADPAGPAHGGFRPAQVLLEGTRVGFVDFDGICQAEPARDVALFLSSVKAVGLLKHLAGGDATADQDRLARVEQLCARFLARYQTLAPISPGRVALWETLDLLTDVMHAGARPSRPS